MTALMNVSKRHDQYPVSPNTLHKISFFQVYGLENGRDINQYLFYQLKKNNSITKG